jgi:ribulose-phosphate 3-epimerase
MERDASTRDALARAGGGCYSAAVAAAPSSASDTSMTLASPRPPIIAPSILSADFSRLGAELAVTDPTRDWVHCDVMDNHFVPNLTVGPLIVRAARALTSAFLDVHLMIERPERLVPQFREAGADQITVHVEAAHDRGLGDVLKQIRSTGARVGLSIKPGTPLAAAEPHLAGLDLLLVMTVEPGFGGQSFMTGMMDKVAAAKAWRERHGAHYLIEVDGGINADTAAVARRAGADVFVAGHAVFRQPDPRAALAGLRAAVAAA